MLYENFEAEICDCKKDVNSVPEAEVFLKTNFYTLKVCKIQ